MSGSPDGTKLQVGKGPRMSFLVVLTVLESRFGRLLPFNLVHLRHPESWTD